MNLRAQFLFEVSSLRSVVKVSATGKTPDAIRRLQLMVVMLLCCLSTNYLPLDL